MSENNLEVKVWTRVWTRTFPLGRQGDPDWATTGFKTSLTNDLFWLDANVGYLKYNFTFYYDCVLADILLITTIKKKLNV